MNSWSVAGVIILAVILAVSIDRYFLVQRGKEPIISTREDCLNQNGLWGRQGLAREESCNLPASDAGENCTSSNQCEGKCVGESIGATSGQCSTYQKVFGYRPFVENGRVPGILCVD